MSVSARSSVATRNAVSALTFNKARQLGAQGARKPPWPRSSGPRQSEIGGRRPPWPSFLHVTRQALHKRVVKGTALGVSRPGDPHGARCGSSISTPTRSAR